MSGVGMGGCDVLRWSGESAVSPDAEPLAASLAAAATPTSPVVVYDSWRVHDHAMICFVLLCFVMRWVVL